MSGETVRSIALIPAQTEGEILVCDERLSFWGGVNPATSEIQDTHHPQHGEQLAGRVVMMPAGRGSSSGSGILAGLALSGIAPAALVFRQSESILTLGAIVAERFFAHTIAVLQLSECDYDALARQSHAVIHSDSVVAGTLLFPLVPPDSRTLVLTSMDKRMLAGEEGEASRVALEVIVDMAKVQGAQCLTDVSRVHIDGCIYADPAYLTFAQRMAALGARVYVPTTLNAISVEQANWQTQGVESTFGKPASELADCYVSMGAQPSFTCAPYLLEHPPGEDELIAWAESNAVIYANSVLGARTTKHPDFLDLCIAITGRAPKAGVYLSANRAARLEVSVTRPEGADDAFWPMLGWLLGEAAPDRIPIVCGLEDSSPSEDDLKALCAAFGTTSSAPMLHIAGVTPEADGASAGDLDRQRIGAQDFGRVWRQFNQGGSSIDLVALGSPHFSARESREFFTALSGRRVKENLSAMITLGRATLDEMRNDGTEAALLDAGVTLVTDVCWCSITEPVFPPSARVVMTNSGKYAHYGPGLSGRDIRFGSLADCAQSAVTGLAPRKPPPWILSEM